MAHLDQIQKIVVAVGDNIETIMNGATMDITIKSMTPEEIIGFSVFKETDDLYKINNIEYTKSGVIAQASLFMIRNIFELRSYSVVLSTQREVSDSKMDLSYWFIEPHSNPNNVPRQLFLLRKYRSKEPEQNIGLTSWI
jgi:hypothetical protein